MGFMLGVRLVGIHLDGDTLAEVDSERTGQVDPESPICAFEIKVEFSPGVVVNMAARVVAVAMLLSVTTRLGVRRRTGTPRAKPI